MDITENSYKKKLKDEYKRFDDLKEFAANKKSEYQLKLQQISLMHKHQIKEMELDFESRFLQIKCEHEKIVHEKNTNKED